MAVRPATEGTRVAGPCVRNWVYARPSSKEVNTTADSRRVFTIHRNKFAARAPWNTSILYARGRDSLREPLILYDKNLKRWPTQKLPSSWSLMPHFDAIDSDTQFCAIKPSHSSSLCLHPVEGDTGDAHGASTVEPRPDKAAPQLPPTLRVYEERRWAMQ